VRNCVNRCPLFTDETTSPIAANVKIFDNNANHDQFFVFDLTLLANWDLAKAALQTHLSAGNSADDYM